MHKLRDWIDLIETTTARPTTNSLGWPIAHTPDALQRFWLWFGRSKLIDRQGRPLVLHHGTKASFRAFDPAKSNSNTNSGVPVGAFVFTNSVDVAQSYAGQTTADWGFATEQDAGTFRRLVVSNEPGDMQKGLAFHKQHAIPDVKTYAEGGNVMPVYLRMLRPLRVNARGDAWHDIYYKDDSWDTNHLMAHAKQSGHDGLIVRNVRDRQEGSGKPGDVFAVFSPSQIKSALSNSGAFHPTSAEIDETSDDLE